MRRLILAGAALLAPTLAHAQSLSLSASDAVAVANNVDRYHVWALPGPVGVTHIHGRLQLQTKFDGFSEVLYVLSISSTCDPNNTDQPLGIWIAKGAYTGDNGLDVDVPLAAPIPASGCLVLDMGSDGAGPIVMGANLTINYDSPPVTGTSALVGIGGEACFGASLARGAAAGAGCAALNSPIRITRPGAAYASVWHVTQPTTLLALWGSVSAATFSGSDGMLAPPSSWWSAFSDVYVAPNGCPNLPTQDGFYGPRNWERLLPADKFDISAVELDGRWRDAQQRAIYSGSPIALPAGACVVDVIAANADGGVDMEVQILAQVR